MSMLTEQCAKLRKAAKAYDDVAPYTAALMCEAADTIMELRNRLTETCHDVSEPPKDCAFWPSPHFRCSECGASHVSIEYVYYCPNCGRQVVR